MPFADNNNWAFGDFSFHLDSKETNNGRFDIPWSFSTLWPLIFSWHIFVFLSVAVELIFDVFVIRATSYHELPVLPGSALDYRMNKKNQISSLSSCYFYQKLYIKKKKSVTKKHSPPPVFCLIFIYDPSVEAQSILEVSSPCSKRVKKQTCIALMM